MTHMWHDPYETLQQHCGIIIDLHCWCRDVRDGMTLYMCVCVCVCVCVYVCVYERHDAYVA